MFEYRTEWAQGDRGKNEQATVLRDSRLAESAGRYADTGNFKAAHTCISAMTGTSKSLEIFKRCLNKAETIADLAEIEMSWVVGNLPGAELFADPQEIASLRINGEADQLISRAAEHANAIEAFDGRRASDNRHVAYVAAAFEALGRIAPDRQLELARTVLPVYRQNGTLYDYIKPFSVALIVAGDAAESARAVEHIRQLSAPRHTRMYTLLEHMRAIRNTGQRTV